MNLEPSIEQVALREQLHDYFTDLRRGPFADLQREDHGPRYRDWMRQLGADGWLGIGWPTEYGGQGRPYVDQFIFFDEAMRCGVPVPMISLNTVGPTLMKYGSDEQRSTFLPPILRGEIDFAIGYSEPDAGTDLAAVRTRARRDGDVYIVDGAKVFTSRGGTADYVWLAARTDPDSVDHRGLSVLIVDTTDPGYSATPIRTLASYDTYSTYYDGVRVPVTHRVGEENDGWRLITTQLNYERVAMASFGGLARTLYEEVLDW
ncbi:MAG: 3-oxocholest-4-en-26-oyl-CoA dehydrogenase alpha subunit, partial [Pseudonocardiales bacterium]|nr:3-oxocholest-4-en-26-oyl-CoA dehydrogenase alpha subunit [Pseudonocardiales bacterium]